MAEMNNTLFLLLFNAVFIIAQAISVWLWNEYAISNMKHIYSSFAIDLSAPTLVLISLWEKNRELLWVIPVACLALLLYAAFVKKTSHFAWAFSILFSVALFLAIWAALLFPIIGGHINFPFRSS